MLLLAIGSPGVTTAFVVPVRQSSLCAVVSDGKLYPTTALSSGSGAAEDDDDSNNDNVTLARMSLEDK